MKPEDVRAAADGGAVVLDMRPPKPFSAMHVPGAVNFQFNRADLADRAELALPRDRPYVVHAEPEPIARVATTILREAGFDVRGHLEGGLKGWRDAGFPVAELPILTVDDLKDRAGAYAVIDTREPFEFKFGHVPGARLVPWTDAWERADELPSDQPLALVCGDQVRSAYVASILKRAGKDAKLVFGGMVDWQERGYPVEKGA